MIELTRQAENAVLLVCFLYDAPCFQAPPPTKKNKMIRNTVRKAAQAGVKMWQVNLRLCPHGVSLLNYFDITRLFNRK
jgi:sugar fermentation stimulation protein A